MDRLGQSQKDVTTKVKDSSGVPFSVRPNTNTDGNPIVQTLRAAVDFGVGFDLIHLHAETGQSTSTHMDGYRDSTSFKATGAEPARIEFAAGVAPDSIRFQTTDAGAVTKNRMLDHLNLNHEWNVTTNARMGHAEYFLVPEASNTTNRTHPRRKPVTVEAMEENDLPVPKARNDLRMPRVLVLIAFVTAGLHAAAGLAGILLLAGGVPAMEPDAEVRFAYMASHVTQWRIGWLTWTLSGAGFVAFLWLLSPPGLAGVAARILAIAAWVVDVTSQVILAIVVPESGRSALETIAWNWSLLGANLGYTAAGMLAVLLAYRAGTLSGLWAVTSAPMWLAGIALAVAHAAGAPHMVSPATAALVAASVLWLGLLGVRNWRAS